jgi:hypothetical protein
MMKNTSISTKTVSIVIHCSFLTSLHWTDLISVTAYLLLHHRSRLYKDRLDSKPWTVRFQQKKTPDHKSRVLVSHSPRTLNKEDPSNPSFAPPRSVMAGKQATVTGFSPSIVALMPLPPSSSLERISKRPGLDKLNLVHEFLLVRPRSSI